MWESDGGEVEKAPEPTTRIKPESYATLIVSVQSTQSVYIPAPVPVPANTHPFSSSIPSTAPSLGLSSQSDLLYLIVVWRIPTLIAAQAMRNVQGTGSSPAPNRPSPASAPALQGSRLEARDGSRSARSLHRRCTSSSAALGTRCYCSHRYRPSQKNRCCCCHRGVTSAPTGEALVPRSRRTKVGLARTMSQRARTDCGRAHGGQVRSGSLRSHGLMTASATYQPCVLYSA